MKRNLFLILALCLPFVALGQTVGSSEISGAPGTSGAAAISGASGTSGAGAISQTVAMATTTIVTPAPTPVGLVCTYDYRRTLLQDDLNAFDASIPIELSYVVSNRAKCDSVDFQQFDSFDKMLKSYCKKKDLLVYVHGDHSLLSDLLCNASDFADTYNVDLLMFIWPSNSIENRSIKNYKQSKHNSIATLSSFATTLDSISAYCARNDINCTLMFHSLGNLFAKNYVRYSLYYDQTKKLGINNVVLNAACVWESDHDIWVDLLAKRIGGKVFITLNRADKILALASEFIEYGDLLGMTSPRVNSRSAVYVDFTDVLRRQADTYQSHGYYFGSILEEIPQLRQFYQNVFSSQGDKFLLNDQNFVKQQGDKIYVGDNIFNLVPIPPKAK